MSRARSAFEARGITVVAVTFSGPEHLGTYRAEMALTHPLLADPSRAAYRAYGLKRGSRWRVWHPAVVARYVVLLFRGRRLKKPRASEDLYQLGGDALIDADGRLLYLFQSRGPEDRPTVPELLAIVDER